MKKQVTRILSAVCAAAAMLSGGAAMIPASAAEVQSARVMGDVNSDLRVTIEDAKKLLDISIASEIGLADNTVNEETNPGDINMNGVIETVDALAVMRYFCQTLVGDQPLWSEVRKLTYHDGTEFNPIFVTDEDEQAYQHLPFEKRGMYLEIGCAEGNPGETVEIPVYIAGITGFAGFQYFQNTPEGALLTDINTELGLGGKRRYIPETGEYESVDFIAEDADFEDMKNWAGFANVENGALVWASADNVALDLKKGMVIATYTYQIPEDAKSGDLFVITANATKTMFISLDESQGSRCIDNQYTLLDGVIAVK